MNTYSSYIHVFTIFDVYSRENVVLYCLPPIMYTRALIKSHRNTAKLSIYSIHFAYTFCKNLARQNVYAHVRQPAVRRYKTAIATPCLHIAASQPAASHQAIRYAPPEPCTLIACLTVCFEISAIMIKWLIYSVIRRVLCIICASKPDIYNVIRGFFEIVTSLLSHLLGYLIPSKSFISKKTT